MASKPEGRFEFRRRARRRALQALYQWRLTDQGAGEIIQQFMEEQDFHNVDTELFTTLVRQVISKHAEIDAKLTPFLDRPVEQLDVIEHVILSIAAYELLHSIEVPHQVVIDQPCQAVRRGAGAQLCQWRPRQGRAAMAGPGQLFSIQAGLSR